MTTAEPKIFVLEFELNAPEIPKEVFEMFTIAQVKLLGLRGWIETEGEKILGIFEGEKEKLVQIKQAIEEAEKFKAQIQVALFAQLREIEKFSCDNFEIHQHKNESPSCTDVGPE